MSDDVSSVYTGPNTRWDSDLSRSDSRWQKICVTDRTPTFRPYGDWGLTGNDFVLRHIVTSSPIIATLRDLKPQEI